MENSLRPAPNTRHMQKCSACRQRKKPCDPHDRDWENSQQKCDYCESQKLPCGPNLKYKDDPTIVRRRTGFPGNDNAAGSNQAEERPIGHLGGTAVSSGPNIAAPTTRRIRGRSGGPPDSNRIEDGTQLFGTPSVEDLEEKAISKLHDFHALGTTLVYVSQPSFAYCHAHGAQQYHDLSIEEKLHELFLNIYGIAMEAKALNEPHIVRWVLFALVFALDQYPRLMDNRKRHILLKTALVFQELGHQWEFEHTLLKIARMHKVSALPSPDNPFHLLATSFSKSSVSTRRVLGDRWNETVGGNYIDPNLSVPPLHTAVQHRHPRVVTLLLNPNDYSSSQLGPSLTTSSDFALNVDERDLNNRTALFAAAASGDKLCCLALLIGGADANTRDEHGHTALEMAARGGNLEIVKTLIHYKATVNPDITYCSSPPLHAAIESENSQIDIIYHLLDCGAQVDLRRIADQKHAIDLATDRGYIELAEAMRCRVPVMSSTPFLAHIVS